MMHMTWLGVWHDAHDLARGCGMMHMTWLGVWHDAHDLARGVV